MDVHIIFARIAWYLLIIILIMRPLAYVLRSQVLMRLLPYRKHVGIICGFAAIAHVVLFLVGHDMLTAYFFDAHFWSLGNLFGWGNVALACLMFPFVTSNRWSQRTLRTKWKTIQQFAYPALCATAVHVALATGEYIQSLIPLFVWIALLIAAKYRRK